ncbi:MAG: radical SAM protein [Candidatus Omnitrophota bacterium]|nr:MAG: radical SAM protein [Candidatus Omnitrophota bacterium]
MVPADKIRLTEERAHLLYRRLQCCDLCPRNCMVNRLKGETGYCGIDRDAVVYTAFLHSGEEPPISGPRGSGTIFFSGCNLKCIYCQNHKFSHLITGRKVKEEELAKIMLALQDKGAENINFVTPSHVLPQILKSLAVAFRNGLGIPLVYNTSGYEKKDILAQLRGVIDIYLSDMKYITLKTAQNYSKAPDYPIFAQESTIHMYDQQKTAIWANNLLKRGLIIRHLALPGHLEESKKVLAWIKANTPEALVSIMFQYRPYFKATSRPEINRPINRSEYSQIRNFVEELDLEGWLQEFNPSQDLAGIHFLPHIEF